MDLPHRRVVIKLGTNTLCDPDGTPDRTFMAALARQIHELRQRGHQILIVSSGAIGTGRRALKVETDDVPTRQACAAVGQPRLMQAWDEAFGRHKIRVGQVLVATDTFAGRCAYQHLRDCIDALLKHGAVPIVNENDSTCTDEIEGGDNDALGALVASRIDADLYVILSDVPGLYDRPPQQEGAQIVARLDRIDDAVLQAAQGGMRSKLESARRLLASGVPVVIAYGRGEEILHELLDSDVEHRPGTWCQAPSRDAAWLGTAPAEGAIEVDEGAEQALRDGYHLLPAGVRGVEGAFPVESVVEIRRGGRTVARAVSLFSSLDLERCRGMQSDDARRVLGIEGQAHVTRRGRVVLQ